LKIVTKRKKETYYSKFFSKHLDELSKELGEKPKTPQNRLERIYKVEHLSTCALEDCVNDLNRRLQKLEKTKKKT
jgi:hypothetical protein